jgi:hypothetical protein
VAEDLGVDVPRRCSAWKGRLASRDVAFDGPDDATTTTAGRRRSTYLEDMLSDDPARQWRTANGRPTARQRLHAAIADLDERSRDILSRRWLTRKRRRCTNWPPSTACPPSASASSRQAAMKKIRGEKGPALTLLHGALSGLLCVALGAFGAHALRASPRRLFAARFRDRRAVPVLSQPGPVRRRPAHAAASPRRHLLRSSAWLFVLGIVCSPAASTCSASPACAGSAPSRRSAAWPSSPAGPAWPPPPGSS